jgi:hypothetical protein
VLARVETTSVLGLAHQDIIELVGAAGPTLKLGIIAGVPARLLAVSALLAEYPGPRDLALWLPLAAVMAVSALIGLAQLFEFAETYWPGSLRRVARPRPLGPGEPAPFVSLHLACCNEPPAMVIATIDSLMALEWPAFEVIVIDNNTRDPACWRPVRAHIERLRRERAPGAPALRFVRLPRWPGFNPKASSIHAVPVLSSMRPSSEGSFRV